MTLYQLPRKGKIILLAAYDDGQVIPENFVLSEEDIAEPGPGRVLVRNEWMALGTVYRDQMHPDLNLPIPAFQVGGPMWARTIGTVIRSNSADLAVGDLVEHFYGWREYSSGSAQEFSRRDRDLLPEPYYYLSQGPTAWRGMVDVARVGDGDVVFVSGASTGVGSLAGQIAKVRGAKLVIGSTSSASKVEFLVDEVGYDAAFDASDGLVADKLRELAPDGITVFFDNVGGAQFEAAVSVAAAHARFALCGSLSGQNGGDGGKPRLNLMEAFPKELVIRPFATLHTPDQIANWNQTFGEWLREGRAVLPHTLVDGGTEAVPEAFCKLLDRRYQGITLASLQSPGQAADG